MSDEIAENVEDTGLIIEGNDQTDEIKPVEAAPEETATSDALSDKKPVVDAEKNAVARLAFEKREEKRRADTAEAELNKLKRQSEKVAITEMPKEADFDYDSGKYEAAVAKYNSDLVADQVNRALTEREGNQAKYAESVRLKTIQDTFWQRAEASKIEGFAESLSSLPTFDKSVLEVIMQADNGVYVADHLAKHADVADIIANSSPAIAAMKIGEISTRLSTNKQANKISNAPEPIETLNQGGNAIGNEWDEVGKGVSIEQRI